MTKESLEKIQAIGTEILFDVVDLCEKHNISYFLLYGTLIGAVRHNGPIPWDDDVDIGMTRENYIRFLEIARKELDPRNEITVMGSGDTNHLSELKIGRKGTKYYLEGTQDLNIMHQIQLDVFVIDYIKDLSPLKSKIYEKIRRVLMIAKLNRDEKRLITRCLKEVKHLKNFVCIAGVWFLHLPRVFFGEKMIERWIYKLFVDESHTSGKMGLVMTDEPLVMVPEEAFETTISHLYDGRKCEIPVGYHEILQLCYGDYMKYPPESQRYNKRMSQYVLEIEE